MAIMNITRVAEFNSTSNRYEQPILVLDSNGNIVRDTLLLKTESIPVTQEDRTVLLTDNLSDSINDGGLNYTTSSNYNETSLSVYYNGLNVTNDIVNKTDNTFSLHSDYSSVIKNGDSIIAIYTVK